MSDYNKGFLSENDMDYISKESKVSFLQTNKVLSEWCKNFDYIKINNYEYSNTLQFTSKILLLNSKNREKKVIIKMKALC